MPSTFGQSFPFMAYPGEAWGGARDGQGSSKGIKYCIYKLFSAGGKQTKPPKPWVYFIQDVTLLTCYNSKLGHQNI